MREWSFEAATAAASGDASDAVHRAPWTARLLNRLLSGAVNARPLRPKPFDLPRVEGLPLRPATFLEGYRITVRREVIARLRFDESLVSGLFEDGDASHRLAETGGMVIIERPLIFHAAAPRPAVEGRRGILNRFGWILHLAYLNRKYYGSGWYVRWIGGVALVALGSGGFCHRDCAARLLATARMLCGAAGIDQAHAGTAGEDRPDRG
jgi:hypothetical protein